MNSRRLIRTPSQLEEAGAEYQVSLIVTLSAWCNRWDRKRGA